MISQHQLENLLTQFRKRKVLTIEELRDIYPCSVPTIRGYLKNWGALTSYNHNGKYYTLADAPEFDQNGLWAYKGVCFSAQGTLKETIIHLISESPYGHSSSELGQLVGLEPRSFMTHYKDLPQIKRERDHGKFIYYSADETKYHAQRAEREAYEKQQQEQVISDHEAVWVLVDFIRHPKSELSQRVGRLHEQGVAVKASGITALLEQHGLLEKKRWSSIPECLSIS